MPDTVSVYTADHDRRSEAKQCPKCRYGYLIYPMESEVGACLSCQIKARGVSPTWPYPQISYRTEAEAYDEGIYDDD